MLDRKGIRKVMKKLENDRDPGEIEHIPEGRKEERYSYFLNGEMKFTFGLTRSSKAKSKRLHYVPTQMHLSTPEYSKLHDCTWYKKDLNKKLNE